MRLPAERARAAERTLRAVAFALIAFALWRLAGGSRANGATRLAGSALSRDLAAIEAAPAGALHVAFGQMPAPADRDALAAMSHAGSRVTWSEPAAKLTALAIVAERSRQPGAPVRVAVASPAAVALFDALSPLDSVGAPVASRGGAVTIGAPSGVVSAVSGSTRIQLTLPPAHATRPVLVLGRAGWEVKFTAAALEEAGWTVEERVFVAPGANVLQGRDGSADTSRFSAVVALDTTLGPAGPSLARFVRDGGGLVLAGDAATAQAVRAIAPGRPASPRPAVSRAFDIANPVDAMPLRALESLQADAVTLTSRGPLAAVAARREGAGRVLETGFDDSWRWRMQGGAGAVAAHRAWWSRMVASVAAAPVVRADEGASAEGAPRARLIAALGAPAADVPPPAPSRTLPPWVLPALLACLLAEWGSRRWRGAQ